MRIDVGSSFQRLFRKRARSLISRRAGIRYVFTGEPEPDTINAFDPAAFRDRLIARYALLDSTATNLDAFLANHARAATLAKPPCHGSSSANAASARPERVTGSRAMLQAALTAAGAYVMADDRPATLYRMVLPDHTCPFGVRAKEMLKEAGYTVDDRVLRSRDEVYAFEAEQGVETTPQVFIAGERIGGSDDLARYLARTTAD